MTSISKSLVVYAIGLVVVWLLLPLGWRGAQAGVGAFARTEDQQLREQVGELLQKNGVAAEQVPETLYERVEAAKAIPAAQQGLQTLLQGRVITRMNWFAVALVVSVVVFGLVGYVCCYVAMDFTFVGAIPVANFLVGNPILHFRLGAWLDSTLQSFIVLGAQIAACYLLGSLAASISTKRNVQRWKRDR